MPVTTTIGMISEFLIPGVLIVFSVGIYLDLLFGGGIVNFLVKYSLIQDPTKSTVKLDKAVIAYLGIIILSISYVIGIIVNFVTYKLIQEGYINRKEAEAALSNFKELKEESKFLFSSEDFEKVKAEEIFEKISGHMRTKAPNLQEDIKSYVSFQRICRGNLAAFVLLTPAILLAMIKYGGLKPYSFECILLLLIVLVGLFLIYYSFQLLKHAVRGEYNLKAQTFFGFVKGTSQNLREFQPTPAPNGKFYPLLTLLLMLASVLSLFKFSKKELPQEDKK